MPHGTPEEVKKAVWENLDAAGEKGGLFVAPTHILEPEVPLENILAYVEACRNYRKYSNNSAVPCAPGLPHMPGLDYNFKSCFLQMHRALSRCIF